MQVRAIGMVGELLLLSPLLLLAFFPCAITHMHHMETLNANYHR